MCPWKSNPGNRALAFNKSISYRLVKENSSNTYFVIASTLIEKLKNDTELKIEKIVDFRGEELKKTFYAKGYRNNRRI